MKISIDLGNGFIKAINEKGERLHFPTTIKEKLNNNMPIFKSKNDFEVQVDGKNYYLGYSAIIQKCVRSWDIGRTFNKDTEVFVNLCSHILSDKESDVDVTLCLGLPYSYYNHLNRGEDLIKLFKNKNYSVSHNDIDKTIHFKEVCVFPQGVGAYFSNIYNMDGSEKEDFDQNTQALFIDIGYRTVDVVALHTIKSSIQLIEDDSFSLEDQGMFIATSKIAKKASIEFEVDTNSIDFAINNFKSKFESMYGTIDLREFEKEAYESLASEIISKISNKIPRIGSYKNIYLTGGGADKIYPYIEKAYPHIKLQDDNIFANAIGYLALYSTR